MQKKPGWDQRCSFFAQRLSYTSGPIFKEGEYADPRICPMTKDFPTFDCDAHVTEPPWIWERAKDWLTKDELEALKTTMWFDQKTKQLIVNGHAGAGLGSQRIGGTPGVVNILSLAGPGLKHDIHARLNVRNLHPETAISQEQAAYLDHKGSYEPQARLRDMDVQASTR